MKKRVARLSVILFFLLSSLPLPFSAEAREPRKPRSQNPRAQAYLDRAWEVLDQEMTLKEIDQAIAYLEKAVALDPDNHEILVELSDEYYQRGDQMPRESRADYKARNKYFKKGHEAAVKAMEIKETAPAHYWIAVNLAAGSENKSILSRAMLFPKLNKHMDWISHHDRDYKYGGTARFWSKVVTRVPEVVIKVVGEDPEEIFEELELSIKKEPRFMDNYIYKAALCNHMDKKEEALGILDQVLRMDPEAFPEERAYNRYAQKKSRAYWKEWTGKEYPDR